MSGANWAKWAILAGVATAALGILLYTQLGRVNEIAIKLNSFALLRAAETTSLLLTVLGLLAALTGGVIWARHAQLKQLPIRAVSVGLLAFLLIKFVDINMHGPTAIFTFVTPATLAMAVLLFAIGGARFLQSRRQQRLGKSSRLSGGVAMFSSNNRSAGVIRVSLAGAAIAVLLLISVGSKRIEAQAQPAQQVQQVQPTNLLPNPYRTVENWAKLPAGRAWGSTAGVTVDSKGNIWVFERCGANTCAGSNLAPILEFDRSGKLLTSFGAGMFVFPHGITVDREGNVWVTDGDGKDGKGHQVFEFSSKGKVLLALGKAGVAGATDDTFNRPSAVAVAANGDIFVADGHGGDSNARIVKFSKGGKFIMTWGKKGTAPGEFDIPHALAFDSQGRLFVADRGNNRIQIFDQNGKFIDQWRQFSRPSGISIDRHDVIYVADSESGSVAKDHAAWKRGIRIGSAKDGSVEAFIPDPNMDPNYMGTSAAEGVAADANGIIYGAEVALKDVKRYVKQ